jgi:diguanylate cyclase (GGDEF)-like protein
MPRHSTNLPLLQERLHAAVTAEQRCAALSQFAMALRNPDPAHGIELGEQALAIAQQLDDPALLAGAYDALAACQRSAGQLAAAAANGAQAVGLFAKLGQTVDEAAARVFQGITLTMLGQMEQALTEFETARDQSRAVGDTPGEADAMLDIAVVHNMMDNNPGALAIYDELLPIYRTMGDSYHIATCLNNAAYARVGWGRRLAREQEFEAARAQFLQAVELAQQALPLAQANNHPDFVVSCMDTLSTAQRELGDFDACIAVLSEQLPLAQRLDSRRMQAVTLGNWGQTCLAQGDFAGAIERLEAADDLFSQLHLAGEHAATLEALVKAHEGLGHFQQALTLQRRLHDFEMKLKSESAERKLAALQSRLQLERTQLELQLAKAREQELDRLNQQLQEQSRMLGKLANEDSLTGLANRRHWLAQSAMLAQSASERQTSLHVAIADIDHFKRINDEHSHDTGDQVLQAVAAIARGVTRSHADALLARYGGEEFVFALAGLDDGGMAALMQDFRVAVQDHVWSNLADDLQVTVSIGWARCGEQDSPVRALSVADRHMYLAKAQGRNRVVGPDVA